MMDTFTTLAAPSEGELKEKGSKFIAYAAPMTNENEFETHLQFVKREHPKARHLCYAWRFGVSGNQYRANDDGEPSGTAGRPILGQIDSFGLTDVGVVVVRYFGGTLLGTSGLIQAYRESAAQALAAAQKKECFIEDKYQLNFSYEILSDVMNALKKTNIPIQKQDFGTTPQIELAFRKSETNEKLLLFFANLKRISVDYAENLLKNMENGIDFQQKRFIFPSDTGGGVFFEKLD